MVKAYSPMGRWRIKGRTIQFTRILWSAIDLSQEIIGILQSKDKENIITENLMTATLPIFPELHKKQIPSIGINYDIGKSIDLIDWFRFELAG